MRNVRTMVNEHEPGKRQKKRRSQKSDMSFQALGGIEMMRPGSYCFMVRRSLKTGFYVNSQLPDTFDTILTIRCHIRVIFQNVSLALLLLSKLIVICKQLIILEFIYTKTTSLISLNRVGCMNLITLFCSISRQVFRQLQVFHIFP